MKNILLLTVVGLTCLSACTSPQPTQAVSTNYPPPPAQSPTGAAPAITPTTTSNPARWTNPLVEQRADAQIFWHDGNYYMTATVPEYDRIEIRRAPTLDGLRSAEPKVIWRKHDTGPMGSHIWAPELHQIDDKWYVYFAAGGARDVWAIRTYILENSSPDPFQGEWVEKGQLKTKWETFTLDSTTFVHHGQRYLLWAQKDPDIRGNTNLYIAKMDTPWSIVQPQVMISKPDLPWEQVKYWVNEGPAPIERNGKVFVTYSASATDYNYCMGLLTANADADLLDPASWTKSPTPVFVTSNATGQYGPGHNSFTTTPDGKTDILIYHARNYRDIVGDPLNDPNRHTRAQILPWNADGTPNFGVPLPDGPATKAVQVIGVVFKPGWATVPRDEKITVVSALKAAGGPTRNASSYVTVTRKKADGTMESLKVDARAAWSDPDKDVELQDGDVVHMGEAILTGPWDG